jgi:hypothetical protein
LALRRSKSLLYIGFFYRYRYRYRFRYRFRYRKVSRMYKNVRYIDRNIYTVADIKKETKKNRRNKKLARITTLVIIDYSEGFGTFQADASIFTNIANGVVDEIGGCLTGLPLV